MAMSSGLSEHVGCLLAHHLVNKLAAIVSHCDLLEMRGSSDPEVLTGVRKIRGLASSAALILRAGECETEAVERILALEEAFAASHKLPTSEQRVPQEQLGGTVESVESR